jgi:hypothetical protein
MIYLSTTKRHNITKEELLMSSIFGKMSLIISTPVESDHEDLAILQANYKVNKDKFIAYELFGINSKGEREEITVHDCESVSLEEFLD